MDVNQARALVDARPDRNALVLLDVRTPGEFAAGHLPGAVLLDINGADFEAKLAQLDRGPAYLVYCRTQNRSGRAAEMMRRMGFGQVSVMLGGFAEWSRRGFPVETPPARPRHEEIPVADSPDSIEPLWERSWPRPAMATAGPVPVLVELQTPSTVEALLLRGTAGRGELAAQAPALRAQGARIQQEQDDFVASLRRSGLPAEELYRSRHTVNGVALVTDEWRIDALRAMPGVKAVRRLVPKRLLNSSSVPFVGAPAVWDPQGLGATGTGVRVGIIDTGVNYLHKDLGGSGSDSGQRFDDSVVPWTSKVVGGYDFVGDSYDGIERPPTRRRPDGLLRRPREPRGRHGGRPGSGRGRQHLLRCLHPGARASRASASAQAWHPAPGSTPCGSSAARVAPPC